MQDFAGGGCGGPPLLLRVLTDPPFLLLTLPAARCSPRRPQEELVVAETRQADGSCAQIVFRNNAAVDAGDLERLCVQVRGACINVWGAIRSG